MTSSVLNEKGDTSRMPLSEQLKLHTARAHDVAENSSFITRLLKGELDTVAFLRLQEQSWLFYSALEEAARAVAHDERGRDLLDTRLERRPALELDLDSLHASTSWRDEISPTPATADYVARLRRIRDTRSFPRLIAHHYVRYLGDLSGGQVISRMMNQHYGIGDEALNFYRFDGVGKLKPYKDQYRAALDALDLNDSERDTLLAEASDAFTFNQRVFADLA